MSNRTTRKDAEQALRRYATAAGLPYGHYLTTDQDRDAELGEPLRYDQDTGRRLYVLTDGLALDGAYGGYQVQQIIGYREGWTKPGDGPCTGVTTPFDGGYHTAREIVAMLDAATASLVTLNRATFADAVLIVENQDRDATRDEILQALAEAQR